ncbi:MAG: histidine phosphatase family protein [Myxococcota bacterium]|nr:histidine phosphatase family protein [Myxococcota bacterium]
MKHIYLVRHGETEANKEDIFRGRNEVPLNQNGLVQAKDTQTYFDAIPIDLVISSPLSRATKTARIIFPQQEIRIEPLLENLDMGDWSGQPKQLFRERHPDLWQKWVTAPETLKFPKGESLSDVYRRARTFLTWLESIDFTSAAVVSHRGVLKTIIAAAIGLKENYYWRFHLDNASISVLAYDERRGFALTKLNYTEHLSSFVVEQD